MRASASTKAPISSPRLVFLDIDGVLVTSSGLIDQKLNPRCVQQLGRIVHATDAKLVVSSTWRMYPDYMKKLRAAFADAKAKLGCDLGAALIGGTPVLKGKTRAEEILAWLGSAEAKTAGVPTTGAPFAILEDSPCHLRHMEAFGLSNAVVQTKMDGKNEADEGITAGHANQVVAILLGRKTAKRQALASSKTSGGADAKQSS